jgi:predicted nucleic acid-binding protein
LIVVDASLMIGWLLREPEAQIGRSIRQTLPERTLIVPSHWPLEIANALRTNVRRKRIDAAHLDDIAAQLSLFDIVVEHIGEIEYVTPLVRFALDEELTAHAAAYVALAKRMDAPLATLDADMRSAAIRHHVAVLPE